MLYEGQTIRLDDGLAQVIRVTECSATVQMCAETVRTVTDRLTGHTAEIRASGRRLTISPNSEVEIVNRRSV